MGILQRLWDQSLECEAGREKAVCSDTHRKFWSPLLPRAGASSPAVSLLSQQASQDISVPPADNREASAGPSHSPPTAFHQFLPSWRGGRRKTCRRPLPAAAPALPCLFPQGFWRPQSHTTLSGNYSSGQLSLAFLSSELCIFLPLFGGDSVAGQPSRASLQGKHSQAAWLRSQEYTPLPAPQV